MDRPIFYVEKELFLREMMEGYAKEAKIAIYTHDGAEDFTHLIEDLRPKALLLDKQTVDTCLYESLIKFIPTFYTGQNPGQNIFTKPLDGSMIFQEIRKKLEN